MLYKKPKNVFNSQ